MSGNFTVLLNSSLAVSGISIQITDVATSKSAPSEGRFGLACALTSPISCGAATVADQGTSGEVGVDLSVSGTAGAGSGGGSNMQLSMTTQSYTGAANSMTVSPGTFPDWVITGGTLNNSLSGSANLAFAANGVPSLATITLTDQLSDTTVTTATSSDQMSGAVKRGATSLATFAVDLNGNGSITYSNGTKGQITNWLITS